MGFPFTYVRQSLLLVTQTFEEFPWVHRSRRLSSLLCGSLKLCRLPPSQGVVGWEVESTQVSLLRGGPNLFPWAGCGVAEGRPRMHLKSEVGVPVLDDRSRRADPSDADASLVARGPEDGPG